MKRSASVFVVAILAALTPVHAETERSVAVSVKRLSSHINYLASDELGGRGVGSEGIELAAEYLANQFLDYGLLPGGDEGSYFQWFEIPKLSRITDRCRLEVVGADVPCRRDEDFTPMPFSAVHAFEGKVAFVGYGITNQEKNYDDYDGIDVKGKVALILRYEPDHWRDDHGGNRTDHASFLAKAQLAKKHGSVALIFVNPPTNEEDDLYPFRRPRPGALPMFHVKRVLADQILAAGGADSIKTLHDRISKNNAPASADLAGVILKGHAGLESGSVKTKNVIGILPGAGPLAHEYVVFGGHYDHLGNVPPRRRPSLDNDFDPADARIHNGADDNASGTAGVLELARIYASGPKPRRSLIFMGFSGEELGLRGSAHFANHPTVPLNDIVAMINLDMIGRLEGRPVEVWATATAKEFGDLVDKHAQSMTNLEVKNVAQMRRDSDHASFYAKDIPVVFVFSGLHADYHRPSDDVEKIDYDGAIGIVQFIQAFADDIIQADRRPTFQKVESTSRRGGRQWDLKVRMGFRPGVPDRDEHPGLRVETVVEGGPADQAGLLAGDIIIAINKTPVKNIGDYANAVKSFKPGDQADVTVRRKGRDVTVKVTFAGRGDR